LKLLAGAFVPRPPARKAELVSLILEQVQGDALRRTWDRLDELQRHAVCEVVHGHDYRLNPDAFKAKYGALPMCGGSSPLGVFFQRSWVMPNDLGDSLRAWVPAPPACRLATVAEPPAIFAQPWRPARSREDGTEDIIHILVRECAGPALHEVHGVLRAIQEGRSAVSDRTRQPGAPAIRALNPVLAGGDFSPEGTPGDGQDAQDVGPIRAFAWPLLVQAAGFAQLRGTRLELTPTGRSALNSPAPAQVLRVLGNLDIVAPHGLAAADESALDRYALRTSDMVWRLDRGLLLGLVEEGTAIAEVQAFLAERCDGPLPELAARLLADTEASASRIRDAGVARIVPCDDPALVALVLNDAGTRPFCLPAGDRHLAIPGPCEPAFRRALRKLGYAISPAAREDLTEDGPTPEHRPRASPASRRGAGQG
jgi:hypothetical protein